VGGIRSYRGEKHYLLEAEGGAKEIVPVWMASPEWQNLEVVEYASLSVAAVRSLSIILKAQRLSCPPSQRGNAGDNGGRNEKKRVSTAANSRDKKC